MKRVFEKLVLVSAAFSLAFFVNPKPVMANHCGFLDPTCSHNGCNDLDVTCNPNIKPITKPISEDAWGEAGSSAYKGAAATMRGRHGSSVGLDDIQKKYLRPHYGNLVDQVVVVYNAKMMNEWTALGQKIPLGGVESAAQTYCNRIYVRDSYQKGNWDQLLLLAHELRHSQQCQELGGEGKFGYHYFREYKRAGLSYENNALERSAQERANTIARNVPDNIVASLSTGKMISSNKNPGLAINAWDGAQHGTVLCLHNSCVSSNPDCTWTYRNGMLISDKDPSLAINAWDGAQHGTVLRLHNSCVSSNPDCTWTYRNGMFISDKDPSLAINAWDGAKHGTVLRLHKSCISSNPDCTWLTK
jgi:hypothetical protein